MADNKAFEMARAMLRLFVILKPKRCDSELTPVEHMVIMCIHHGTENGNIITPSDVCYELGISKSHLTNMLNRLESKGFITRKISPENRRNVLIELSEKSQAMHTQFHSNLDNVTGEICDYLGPEDTEKFLEILNKIYKFTGEKERK